MKLSIRVLVLLILSCIATAIHASSLSVWQDADALSLRSDLPLMAKASEARHLTANIDVLSAQLLEADNVDLEIPLPNGQTVIYHLEYYPIAEQGLLDKYPQIRTFRGIDVADPSNNGRFDISPAGFRGMFSHEGKRVFIDPKYIGNSTIHMSYYENDAQPLSAQPNDQVVLPGVIRPSSLSRRVLAKGASDGNLRTYRLAVAATGEYADIFSNDSDPIATKRSLAMAAIMSAVNRVNEVFEDDVGISFSLIANNDLIIYVDSTTDPYFNLSFNELEVNQTNIDTVIGPANYDVGHLFGTEFGGLANLGSACTDGAKARGQSGSGDPTGDSYHIQVVAHELGHQFGANHTFNGTADACFGNRNASTAYEPGSGSTIMAYSNICGDENLPDPDDPSADQVDTDPYFHAGSIAEITRFATTGVFDIGGSLLSGTTCGVVTTPVNAVPDAVAGEDETIPANTPLFLSGSATDGDGDTLTYVWEQLDAGAASSNVEEWVDDGSRALFRSLLPTTNSDRYIPDLVDVVDDDLDNGESIPSSNREINLRLTVRDGNGGTAFENKVLTVTTSAGPFDLITPEFDDVWTQGTTVVTWDVANTDVSPVNCSQVSIFYDDTIIDGNNVTSTSFSTPLVTNVVNNGVALVPTPTTPTLNARVMIRCADNVFYTISESTFEVSASFDPIVSSVSNASASEGSSLDFSIVMSAEPLVNESVDFSLSTNTASFDDFGSVSFSSGVVNNNDGTLTVPAGVVTFSAVVSTIEDSLVESDETFVLSVGSASGTGTINDDDTDSSGGDSTSCSSTPGCEEGSSGGSSGMIMLVFMSLLLVSARRRRLL